MSGAIEEALELLGVSRGSDLESVARAYRRLARANHPDVSAEPDAAQRFARIAEAYHLVRDQTRVDPADPPRSVDRTAEPSEEGFRRPSSPDVGRHHTPDPRLFVDVDAASGLPAWLWLTPFGSNPPRDRPPIVAGPVTVTPPSGESPARRRTRGEG